MNLQVVGLDFDNTIVSYDELFHGTAGKFVTIKDSVGRSKREIRDYLRLLPEGEVIWQRLQAEVYGPEMSRATLMPGAREFLCFCRSRGTRVRVISHKTRFAAMGSESVDLRAVALSWMRENGFFDSDALGLQERDIFFEGTRQEKIERIRSCGCAAFVDDLPEVLLDPSFPANVHKILFAPNGLSDAPPEPLVIARDWDEVANALFK